MQQRIEAIAYEEVVEHEVTRRLKVEILPSKPRSHPPF